VSGQLHCPVAFTLGKYPPVLLVEPIRTYVEVKNSDLCRQSYPERPLGCEDVYSGFGCGQVQREFSWTLGVTCRLLNTSHFPAHMIVCHLQRLSNDTVHSSLAFVLAEPLDMPP
jgi:hypothetical protein